MTKRIWLLAAALAACTDAHGPEGSTQTGNPPTLDRARVTLVVGADDIRIAGEPGAATPGGATIEITNLTTGEVIEATAASDGSFDVSVDGSPDDAFVVRVIADGEQSTPVYVVRGGAEIAGEADGSLSCEQYTALATAVLDASSAAADRSCSTSADCSPVALSMSCVPCFLSEASSSGASQIEATFEAVTGGLCAAALDEGCRFPIPRCVAPDPPECVAGQCTAATAELSCDERQMKSSEILSEAVQAADKRCESDDDCMLFGGGTMCGTGLCGGALASSEGGAQIAQTLAEINAGICANFREDGCRNPPMLCPFVPNPPPRCEAGQCTQSPPATDGGTPDCTTCFAETLSWAPNGGLVPIEEVSELAPCAHYTHRRVPRADPAAALSCELDLVACNSVASTGAIMTALGHADVQRALEESPVLYGTDPRAVDGTVFRIQLGERMIEVGGSCEGAPPNCVPAPEGVTMLVELLRDVDATLLMTEECADFAR
jgi:hypothetical protein